MKRLVVPVLAVFLMISAVSCGDSGSGSRSRGIPSSTATTVTTAPPQGGPTTAPTEAAEGGVTAVEGSPCDLLTTDEVSSATGFTVVSATESPPASCIYDLGDEAGVDIFVDVERGEGGVFAPSALLDAYQELVPAGDAEMVPGLGSRAVYAAGYRAIAVGDSEGHFIVIGVNGGYQALSEPADSLVQMARQALGRL